MNEEEIVKKQLRKNIFTNFITIIIILVTLGLFIYYSFINSIFVSSDKELKEAYTQMTRFKTTQEEEQVNSINTSEKIEVIDRLYQLMLKQTSPRIIYLLRNKEGNIISDVSQGGYVSDMFSQIEFNTENLDKVYSCSLDGQYEYRAIVFKWDSNLYGQALINVDSEMEIIQTFKSSLITSIIIAIVLITVASYFLSRKTLQPLIKSLERQKQFVQNASHELRTPLSIIQAKQETLLEKPNEKIIDNAKDISITLKETTRLKKLISQLMEEAREDKNMTLKDAKSFKIDDLISEIKILYQDLATKQKKKLDFNLNFNSYIYGNEDKIKELLVILLDNAFKYTNKNDKITISTLKKDGKCQIEIEDTGIGISKEAQKHIFERFYREEKSRQRDKGGMGLGLSLAYEIVKLHKGQIKVISSQNEFTKFIIRLPIRQESKREQKNIKQ